MPCNVEGDHYAYLKEKEFNKVKVEIDKLTRMLCAIIKHVDIEYIESTFPYSDECESILNEIKEWWGKHRVNDIKILENELLKKLEKTTAEYFKSIPEQEKNLISNYKIFCELYPNKK